MNMFILGGWFETSIAKLWLSLCRGIYSIVVWLYKVFMTVAKVNLFDRETFNTLTSKMYIVIAIAMLFIFAYNIILMIINPDDKKGTGQTTKIVKETVISFVLIILLPTIFNYMYVFQNNILGSNIIETIMLGGIGHGANAEEYDKTCDFSGFTNYSDMSYLEGDCQNYRDVVPSSDKGAYMIPVTMMSAFYTPVNFSLDDCTQYLQGDDSKISNNDDRKVCKSYFFALTHGRYNGNVQYLTTDITLLDAYTADDARMDFNFLLAILAGCLAVYMFFCYAMEIGVRVAKLGVLQIISPLPVMMRIIPKQKEAVFDKWFKQLLNAYIDVFIRLIIIYFALFAISLVPGVLETLFSSLGGGFSSVKLLATVFVILGILKFGQEAPGLMKEFFNSVGNFSLKSPAKQIKENKALMGGIGAAGTMGNRALNKAGNYSRIAKNKDMSKKDKAWAMAKNTGSLFNPVGYGKAAYGGFQATKDGKNVLDGINDATAKNLTDSGMFYKAKKTVQEAWSQGKHYATTDYMKNSDALKQKIKIQQLIVEAEKGMFDVLDKDKRVENMNNYYEELKKKAAEKGDFASRDAFEARRKADVDALKSAILKEKRTGAVASIEQDSKNKEFKIGNGTIDMSKMDAEFNANFDKLAKVLNDNFASVNDILTESHQDALASKEELAKLFTDNNTANLKKLDDLKKVSEKQLESNKVQLSQIESLKKGKKD